MIWEYDIPLAPVSVNNAYFNMPGKGRRPTEKLKNFKEAFGLYCYEQDLSAGREPPVINAKLRMDWVFHITDRPDLDNCIKTAQDALADYFGINDRNIRSLGAERVKTKESKQRIVVRVEEL